MIGTSVFVAATMFGCGGTVSPVNSSAENQTLSEKPNIMMVLLDDLGYSDLGSYGSEVQTPNIDALAQESAQFSNFHAYPLCAPTRAALMTGQDPHRVGLGSMEDLAPPGVPQTTPGYRGSLEGDFVGVAEALGEGGYDTYQVGKWHLGGEAGQTPSDLGFNENFTLYDAGASYFSDRLRLSKRTEEPADTVIYERNGETVDSLPEDFFATRSYTDEMIGMVDSSIATDKPFFGYLAYTAPHDPLHVEDKNLVDHYAKLYENTDYSELRQERIDRMEEVGLIERGTETRSPEQVSEWNTLSPEQQKDLAQRLAVYAATIHEADEHIGRLVEYLKSVEEYDNTLIVLASDNGPAGNTRQLYIRPGTEEWHEAQYPQIGDVDAYGERGSFPSLALPNAQVSSGPFFHAKNTLSEGGIRVPAVIKPPADDSPVGHRVVDTFAHISDLYPTFVDYAGVSPRHSDELLGDSMRPLLEGESESIGDDDFGWEHFGQRAFRSGDWKLIFAPEAYGGTGEYALFNVGQDPGETRNLINVNPGIARDLDQKWQEYARRNGVVVVDFAAVNEKAPAGAQRSFFIDWAHADE